MFLKEFHGMMENKSMKDRSSDILMATGLKTDMG